MLNSLLSKFGMTEASVARCKVASIKEMVQNEHVVFWDMQHAAVTLSDSAKGLNWKTGCVHISSSQYLWVNLQRHRPLFIVN